MKTPNDKPTPEPKSPTTKITRVLSPEIAAIRAKAKVEVQAFRAQRLSIERTDKFIAETLPTLTSGDRARIKSELSDQE